MTTSKRRLIKAVPTGTRTLTGSSESAPAEAHASLFSVVLLYSCKSHDHLVDVVVDLISHFLELVVNHDEISLVGVKVSILPAPLNLSLVNAGGQVKGCL